MQADAITAVSNGVAEDIARSIGIARETITTLYNPTITPDFATRASEPIEHPWFADGAPPVLLAVGRTTFQKDFSTLLRAFARVRRDRPGPPGDHRRGQREADRAPARAWPASSACRTTSRCSAISATRCPIWRARRCSC